MKTRLKIIGILVLIYVLLVAIFWLSGVCPKYINLMPRVVLDVQDKGITLSEFLYAVKLCPLTQAVY